MEAIHKEIDYVIAAKVVDLCEKQHIHPAAKQALEARLRNIPNRTYLWLELVWMEIIDFAARSYHEFRSKIEMLPTTVEAAYESILSRSPDDNQAENVLSCVLGAEKNLKVIEVDGLTAGLYLCRPGTDMLSETRGTEERTKFLLQYTGWLVVVTENEVFLLRQMAKELSRRDYQEPDNFHDNTEERLKWKHNLDSSEINFELAKRCVERAVDSDEEDSGSSGRTWYITPNETSEMFGNELKRGKTLVIHLKGESYSNAIQIAPKRIRGAILIELFEYVEHIYCCEEEFSKLLLWASSTSHIGEVERLVDLGHGFPHGSLYDDALLAALNKGFEHVAAILLTAGANIDCAWEPQIKTLFMAAVIAGDLSLADRCLKIVGNIDFERETYTALVRSTMSEEKWAKRMTMMLLVWTSNDRMLNKFPNASYYPPMPILVRVAERGWYDVVSYLLKRDIASELMRLKDREGRTAWRCALDSQHYRCAGAIMAKQVYLVKRHGRTESPPKGRAWCCVIRRKKKGDKHKKSG